MKPVKEGGVESLWVAWSAKVNGIAVPCWAVEKDGSHSLFHGSETIAVITTEIECLSSR